MKTCAIYCRSFIIFKFISKQNKPRTCYKLRRHLNSCYTVYERKNYKFHILLSQKSKCLDFIVLRKRKHIEKKNKQHFVLNVLKQTFSFNRNLTLSYVKPFSKNWTMDSSVFTCPNFFSYGLYGLAGIAEGIVSPFVLLGFSLLLFLVLCFYFLMSFSF